ncbi:hypothetical protein BO71DRAFT_65481 [Aspergillus ellipticus CBS 707.79]|uniref:Uncharacterized protein n=1 Tax=Aspergillus ellipticus CBS 707.79 TaxID=1448320 RepID=A0A319DL90_9EURO|nr:hypothetical protein BO71DRAFT_65481 [Aspergillus ellipticus CBS 707.79]
MGESPRIAPASRHLISPAATFVYRNLRSAPPPRKSVRCSIRHRPYVETSVGWSSNPECGRTRNGMEWNEVRSCSASGLHSAGVPSSTYHLEGQGRLWCHCAYTLTGFQMRLSAGRMGLRMGVEGRSFGLSSLSSLPSRAGHCPCHCTYLTHSIWCILTCYCSLSAQLFQTSSRASSRGSL